MKIVTLVLLIITSSFSFNGELFFKNHSPLFWEGLSDIRFGQSKEEVLTILNKNLPTIQEYGKRYNLNRKMVVWTDSITTEDWVAQTNPRSKFRSGRFRLEMPREYIKLYMYGVSKIYIGFKDTIGVDKLFCFTIYNGANPFYINIKSKYADRTEVTGLYHVGINYEKFKVKFLYHVLEEIGYGRNCRDFNYNCQKEALDGGYIFTVDPNVRLEWHKRGNLFNIQYLFDMESYERATANNIVEWEKENSNKYPSLN